MANFRFFSFNLFCWWFSGLGLTHGQAQTPRGVLVGARFLVPKWVVYSGSLFRMLADKAIFLIASTPAWGVWFSTLQGVSSPTTTPCAYVWTPGAWSREGGRGRSVPFSGVKVWTEQYRLMGVQIAGRHNGYENSPSSQPQADGREEPIIQPKTINGKINIKQEFQFTSKWSNALYPLESYSLNTLPIFAENISQILKI